MGTPYFRMGDIALPSIGWRWYALTNLERFAFI